MRWDSLTGLEPETEEDRKRLRREKLRIFSSFGRVAVVSLLLFTLLASLSEELVTEMSTEIALGSFTWTFLVVDPLVLAAFVWSLSPMIFGTYGLWQLKRAAHNGSRRYDWEVDQDG